MKIWLDSRLPQPKGFTHHAKNLTELKMIVENTNQRIEVLSLNYELDGTATGYDALKWIAKEHIDRYPTIVLAHTANHKGAVALMAFDAFIKTTFF